MTKISDKLNQMGMKIAYVLFNCFSFIFRPTTKGVLIGVWLGDRILVIKNSYHHKYSLPGGFVRPGEKLKSAAIRELSEEVGITIADGSLNDFGSAESRIHFRQEKLTYFEISLKQRPFIVIDNREVVWAEFILPEKVLKLNLTQPAKRYLICKMGH
jgi:ADP-ribose pyrophosphatase YjhB (NUDIX family)